MFIVIEGVDGAGKSSIIEQLKERLLFGQKMPLVFTCEPFEGGVLEEQLSFLLLKNQQELDLKTQLLLFGSLRLLHLEKVIKPALKRGLPVISDRYFFSSWAYQSDPTLKGLSIKEIKKFNDWLSESLYPDLVIFLSMPIENVEERKKLEEDRFESRGKNFLELVAQRYDYFFIQRASDFVPPTTEIRIIDATKQKEVVAQEVFEIVNEFLKKRGQL